MMTAIALASGAFAVAALCAAAMGFSIQRGATCTVAAVDELLTRGSARRLVSLVEASIWVAAGLLVAQAAGVLPRMPPGYALTGWTVLGGALLGLGAFVTGACVFGAVARFGSGQWSYAATPLGFYLGCLSVDAVFALPAPQPLHDASPVLSAPRWVAWVLAGLLLWRLVRLLAKRRWSPRNATIAIGLTFVAMLLLAGAWAYTDLLADLARGMAGNVAARSLLLAALLLGATAGGWHAGLLRATPPSARELLRCLAGGVLMGWGSLLIPGGNDGLILVGMPLLWPYAWVAVLAMALAIAAAQWVAARVAEPATSHFGHGRSDAGSAS